MSKKISLLIPALLLLAFIGGISLQSCSSEPETSNTPTVAPPSALPTPSIAPLNNQATNQPAPPQANQANGPHYICGDGCAGGSGAAAGPCPVCGKALVHNQAFHNQDNANANANAQNPPPAKVEPPQNAKGVWHYTCAKGCAGGGGAAGACGTCGGALAHNTGYHN